MKQCAAILLLWALVPGCSYDWNRYDLASDSSVTPDAAADTSLDSSTDSSADSSRLDSALPDTGGGDSGVDTGRDAEVVDPSLIHHFRLDEGAGTTITDEITGDASGTLRGATFVAGRLGMALSFDGDAMHDVEVSLASPLSLGTRFTIAVWFRLSRTPTDVNTLVACHGDPETEMAIRDGDLQGIGYVAPSGDWPEHDVLGMTTLGVDRWYHAAFVVDGVDLKIYLDGSLDAQQTIGAVGPNGAPGALCFFGQSGYPWKPNWLTGALDDVRIYDRPLDAGEVSALSR